ncbi:thymidine kinase [Mytilus galloprovincialis]|uniref:Thymidine kinase n=1 Tax=Mytilus galloprovincialis TaxID=29158 RepID=A0A8B6C6N1_MYTGA|nr:thymidine kinase [Mytilus galloprovincialis]
MIGLQHLNLENVKKPSSKDKGFTVAVEGNIGSGKSTFLQYFKNFPEVDLIPEPVSKWKDVNGFNTLEMMYKDASRWSLAFQSYVQLTMAEGHRKDLKDKEYLQSLHDLHEDWLMHQKQFELPAPVIVIEANEDISKLYPKFNQCKEEIFAKIQSLPSMEELEKDIFKEVNLS